MLSNDVETFAHSNDKRTHLELAGDGIKGIKILDPAPGRGGRPGKNEACKKNKNKGSRRNRNNSTTTPPSDEATGSVEQDAELIPQQ
uniref:Uncharacterized protein n=1 Tax=Timema douglasi TaxID=61478 RepID=A0A7R8VL13_TIMDO|nr:unnamed protein product [Timema douglasi]